MKQALILIIGIGILTACNQSGSKNPTADSLGVKAIDTFGRNDTMYYERMQNKTNAGPADSLGRAPVRNDTANYQRLPQKTAPDSTGSRQ